MKPPRPPRIEPRRAADFSAELRERARTWIPSWGLDDAPGNFGRALLEVAARLSSEVAERLDLAGEKMRLGFLDWLAVRRQAARPARVPVTFKLTDKAREAVTAPEGTRLQAEVVGQSVVFETEGEVRVVPGKLDTVVAVDGGEDAFHLGPPPLTDLKPLEVAPDAWQLKSFAAAGAEALQLDPAPGPPAGTIVEAEGSQYRVTKADKGLVSVEPRLDAELDAGKTVRKVTTLAPFDGAARNWQEHALYLGHMELLDIEAAATIEVVGAQALASGVTWQYWGKADPGDQVGWQPLTLVKGPQGDALALRKSQGAVVPLEIDGKKSRWIRACASRVTAEAPRLSTDTLRLRVNWQDLPDCPRGTPPSDSSPLVEGMANTTPLVLGTRFFPLGKEPRQFDAFYVGCQEAFSKKGASVRLCFEMADPSFKALTRIPLAGGDFLAGIARDRSLHVVGFDPSTGRARPIADRRALQPPLPGFEGKGISGRRLELDGPPGRLPTWPVAGDPQGFVVAASTGNTVWTWREKGEPVERTASGWKALKPIPETLSPAAPLDGLVCMAGSTGPCLVALQGGSLAAIYPEDSDPTWAPVTLPGSPSLRTLAPVLAPGLGRLATSTVHGMVAIDVSGKVYAVSLAGAFTELTGHVRLDVPPAAFRRGSELVVVVAKDTGKIATIYWDTPTGTPRVVETPLDAGDTVLGFDALEGLTGIHILAAVQNAKGAYLASWILPDVGTPAVMLRVPVPVGVGVPGGGPTAIARHVILPGTRADLLVADFEVNGTRDLRGLLQGAVLPSSDPLLQPSDTVARWVPSTADLEARDTAGSGIQGEGGVFYHLSSAFPIDATGPLYAYDRHHPRSGRKVADDKLRLDAVDHSVEVGARLLMAGTFYEVVGRNTAVEPWTVEVTPDLPGSVGPLEYYPPVSTSGRVVSFFEVDTQAVGSWSAALLQPWALTRPFQVVRAFATRPQGTTFVAVLDEEQAGAAVQQSYRVDTAIGAWSSQLDDVSTNPDLAWEYWNGKGWWTLGAVDDATQNLKKTNHVDFSVPTDIASSDWAGKTNHWIRARLVGGDYGRERVTVATSPPDPQGVTRQTYERSSDDIHAPLALRLRVSYALCQPADPTYVLTRDSGSLRDQSDANRTAGALVEAFIPLAVTLGRLSSLRQPEAEVCPPPCSCPPEAGRSTSTDAAAAVPASAAAPTPAKGRALLLGIDGQPSGTPVRILLVVEQERPHGDFAPLRVEALVAGRFVPVSHEDATRALGETGILTLSFALPPTRRELFGVSRTWLRLSPAERGGATGAWAPSLRGVYLNAAWASAAETITRELLGSSVGAPDLVLRLARPPVLRGTLELRVREPLGDEERTALRRGDEAMVLTGLAGLPGDWVRWRQVDDPADEAPGERVYALEESSGELRFGDGLHGAIPPVGRDAIVAFRYRRTEVAGESVPGNAVAPRAPLGLSSPVQGVEAVVAADQAAGGAPAETDARVLRFGAAWLRHRGRAGTARDLEDLALQSSPDVVQARCVTRAGRVRLVVVMRGREPHPTAAQARELRSLLLRAGPPWLAGSRALRILGPSVRRLRVALRLAVASLDRAGALDTEVRWRIAQLLDPVAGGAEKAGWPLGENPRPGDVALALDGAAHLEAIEKVELLEIGADGRELAWPAALGESELAVLDVDGVRIDFAATAGVA